MGIRFACPNGHPLHVKAHLAGKRGICPQCQAKVQIPNLPDQPAEATPAVLAPAAPSPVATTPENPAVELPAATAVAPPQQESPPAATPVAGEAPAATGMATPEPLESAAATPVWYVRPASGGQFGPADEGLLRQWVSEGRVASDSYVWCTGWPDWKRMSELRHLFPALVADLPAAEVELPGGASPASSAAPASVATARYQRRKKKAQASQMVAATVLVLLALLLGGVLFWVLSRQPGASSPGTPPAGTPAPASPPQDVAVEGEDAETAEEADTPETE